MNRARFFLILLSFLVFLNITGLIYAESNYVLPYPSEMPGSRFYKAQEFVEKISKFWYFRNFGQFKYSLNNSDKYLVEAKPLFEYDQFLLGQNSLERSNNYFSFLSSYLEKAKKEGKDISLNADMLSSASQKHIEVLKKIKKEVPIIVTWKPEKDVPTVINLHDEIDEAIKVREKSL